MVSRTFSWVAGRTSGLPCSTSETVDFDTPAASATSMIVTRLRPPGSMLSLASPTFRRRFFGTFQKTNRILARLNGRVNEKTYLNFWNVPIQRGRQTSRWP